jgi:hypothetical protein
MPLLPLWAFLASSRVNVTFTFTFTYIACVVHPSVVSYDVWRSNVANINSGCSWVLTPYTLLDWYRRFDLSFWLCLLGRIRVDNHTCVPKTVATEPVTQEPIHSAWPHMPECGNHIMYSDQQMHKYLTKITLLHVSTLLVSSSGSL